MASVTKNPIVLNSANYIYNWFTTVNHKNNNLIKNSNMLEAVESDEVILKNLQKNKTNKEKYDDIEKRLNCLMERIDSE